jgi:hypothetical protein
MKYRLLKVAFSVFKVSPSIGFRLLKLASPIVFDADSPDPKLNKGQSSEVVWRIQNSKGEGPWQGEWPSLQDRKEFLVLDQLKINFKLPTIPSPEDDEGFLKEERRKEFFSKYIFGFETKEKAEDTLLPKQRALLTNNGFHLVPNKSKKNLVKWDTGVL